MQSVLAALALAALLAGCARLPDREVALTADREAIATIPGFEDVRSWADSPPLSTLDTLPAIFDAHTTTAQRQNEVSVLAISGGGPYGAFAVGMLNGWTERGDRPEWLLVTGVSTGALIAPFAFVGSEWDDELRQVFTTARDEDIVNFVGVSALLNDIALGDSSPLRRTIERYIDLTFLEAVAAEHRRGRRLWVGTTEFDARRSMIWDLGAIALRGDEAARKLFIDAMVASASIPVALNPVTITALAGGAKVTELHVDGGLTRNVLGWPDIHFAQVLDAHPGLGDLPRRVYAIVNNTLQTQPQKIEGGIFDIARASISMLIGGNTKGDLYRMHWQALNEGFEFNLAYVPREFQSDSSAIFDPALMSALYETGEAQIAQAGPWVSQPPNLPEGDERVLFAISD